MTKSGEQFVGLMGSMARENVLDHPSVLVSWIAASEAEAYADGYRDCEQGYPPRATHPWSRSAEAPITEEQP